MKRYLTGLLAALVLAGCQDVVTGPGAIHPQSDAPASSKSVSNPVSSPYACFVSVATPSGPDAYRYWRLRLEFPARALSANGDTALYRFRRYGAGNRVQVLANCVIPRTELAVEMVSRRFHVPGGKVVSKPLPTPIDEVTTRDCYKQMDGSYICDGVSGGGGDGGGGGGGSFCQRYPYDRACTGGGPTEPYIDPCAGDYNCDPGGGGSTPCADCNPEPTWEADPSGTCNADAETSPSWDDGTSRGCEQLGGPFILKSVKLMECPATAIGSANPVNSGGVTSYSLTRMGEIRSKSWGGAIRYDVAHYKGTVTTTSGEPRTAEGEVWCEVGVGIFSFR